MEEEPKEIELTFDITSGKKHIKAKTIYEPEKTLLDLINFIASKIGVDAGDITNIIIDDNKEEDYGLKTEWIVLFGEKVSKDELIFNITVTTKEKPSKKLVSESKSLSESLKSTVDVTYRDRIDALKRAYRDFDFDKCILYNKQPKINEKYKIPEYFRYASSEECASVIE